MKNMKRKTSNRTSKPRGADGKPPFCSMRLLYCPFCGCKMGILHLGLWRWYGEHRTGCVLESNPSHAYGRCEDMIKAWNTRQDNDKALPRGGEKETPDAKKN
jgi:hypothetical protein